MPMASGTRAKSQRARRMRRVQRRSFRRCCSTSQLPLSVPICLWFLVSFVCGEWLLFDGGRYTVKYTDNTEDDDIAEHRIRPRGGQVRSFVFVFALVCVLQWLR